MVYRKTQVLPITRQTIENNAKKWLGMLKYSESGIVIQVQDDSEYRVGEIITNNGILRQVLGPYYRKYILVLIEIIDNEPIRQIYLELLRESRNRKMSFKNIPKDLEGLVHSVVEKGYEIGIIIGRVQTLPEKQFNQLFHDLEHLLETQHNTSVIVFTERDLIREEYSNLLDKCSLLFDHVEKYPLYGNKDIEQFVRYNESIWKIKLKPERVREIIDECGGYLWLVSHVQRYFRDRLDASWEELQRDSALRIKLVTIINKLTPVEREMMSAICIRPLSAVEKNSREYEYLVEMGLIRREGKADKLGIPLLSIVLKQEMTLDNLEINKDKIEINGIGIESQLSKSELSVLRVLIENKKKVVNRDLLAQAIWKSSWEKMYSNWAIDRIIYRLRGKLEKLGIDPQLLQSVRKRGYKLG